MKIKQTINSSRYIIGFEKAFLNTLLLVFLLSLFPQTSKAAIVSLSPTPLSVNQNDSFFLDLVGTDFNAGTLDGGGVNISFDSSVLNVLNVSVNTTDWEFFSTPGTIDNANNTGLGTISGISFNSFQDRTGDLLFATIEFVAVGTGTSLIGLSEYLLNPFTTSNANPYPNLILDQTGSVTVQHLPIPAAGWLFVCALGFLASQVRRKL